MVSFFRQCVKAGYKIPEDHGYAYGFDPHDALLDIHIGKPVELDYTNKKKCVGDLYLPNKSGLITEITPEKELVKMEGAFKAELFTAKGEIQKSSRRGTDASGYVHVEGSTIEEVEERMHRILDMFKIETQNVERG
ncbi:MAG: hypothetical protein JXR63_02345 [Spirochaetales bacterium]|nr:hypothetical protein [Spirochaetales bacterium]